MLSKRAPSYSFEHIALAVMVTVFILCGIVYSVSTPFLDVSDEVRHYAMVEQLAQGLGLPRQDPAHHGFYEQEGSQPPLYYAVMALLAQPFDRSDFMQLAQFNPHALLGRADATSNVNQLIHTAAEAFPWRGTVLVVQLMRFLGIAMGAVTVLCTYGIARGLLSRSDAHTSERRMALVALAAASLTAFNPMFVFIMASVNNDTLATMLSSLSLLLAIRTLRLGLTWRRAAVLGLVLGLAALSKSSALALAAIIPPAIFINEWLQRRADTRSARWLSLLPPLLLMAGLVFIIAGWWYVRNAMLYSGDFTGTTMMASIAGARDKLPSFLELVAEWDGFRKAWLGLFGAVNIPMADWIYAVFDVILLAAGIGWLSKIRDWVIGARERVQTIATLTCFGAFAIAFAALIRWTSITLASQGRLLFPVIAVVSTFIALGLARLVYLSHIRIWQRLAMGLVAVICVGFAILTAVSPFLYIQPAYATPHILASEAQLPTDMVKTELRFDDNVRWIGYHVDTPRIKPGESFDVTLYWQGLKPMTADYSLFIRLYGRDDTQIFLLDTYPGGGTWQTTRWQPGDIVADHYRLNVTGNMTNTRLMPTALWLDIGFWNFTSKRFLQTYDGSGQPTGRQRYEAGSMAITTQSEAELHYAGAGLSAAHTAISTAQDASSLTINLKWFVTKDFTEDYTVFMHLFNSTGERVAQADGRAAGGAFSARWWRAGDAVADVHVMKLPDHLPAGEYVLKYGLYKPVDGTRMPAFDEQSQPIADAALTQTVTIK
ncbi:MAG TPA: glycosyltransferase family 39 protein [Anaerolineae bacterium]|jgi:hypothetical protein